MGLGLIVGEAIAWDAHTPPFYASSMRGYGVDADMPRPPFILAKVVWRFLYETPLRYLLSPVWWLVKGLVRAVAGVLGFGAGLASGPGNGGGGRSGRGGQVRGQWGGPGRVLMDDRVMGARRVAVGMEADEYI